MKAHQAIERLAELAAQSATANINANICGTGTDHREAVEKEAELEAHLEWCVENLILAPQLEPRVGRNK